MSSLFGLLSPGKEYFLAGVRLVWFVDPRAHTVTEWVGLQVYFWWITTIFSSVISSTA